MQSQKLHMFIPAVLIAAAFAALDASAVTTRTWDGGGSTTNWSDGNNWSPNGVPAASDPVIFNGTSNKACTFNAADSCASLTINSGYSNTITISANLTINGALTINSGTVSFSGSPILTVEGSIIKSGGAFNAGTGTVVLTTSTAATLSGGLTFKNLEVNKGAHVTVNSTDSTPVIVTGTLTLTNGYLDSQTPSDPTKGVLCARGTIDQNTGFDGGTAQLWIDGTGNQTLDGSGSNAYGDLMDVTVNKPATSKLTLVGIVRSSQDLKLLSGDFVAGTSTWRSVDNNNVAITGDIKFYDLDINLGTGYTFDILGNVTVSGTLLLSNGILKLHDDKRLYIKGNVSTVASGTSIVPNGSTVEACGTTAQTLDWQDKTLQGLEVTNITGLVSFTTGLTLNSGGTFYIKPGATVQFQSYKDYYFNGQLDWNGQPGNLITISSSGSAKYTAHTTGARNLTYVNIERCEVSGGTYYAYESIDGGSNVSVVFVAAGTPIPADDSYAAIEDTPLSVAAPGVLANDVDPQGNPITAIKITNPSHGSVTLNANGSFTYTPAANYFGTDSFTYKASDGSHQSTAATVTLTVAGTPDPPTANNGSTSLYEDQVTYAFMSGSDPDNDPFTYSIVSQGSKGTVQIQNANTGYFKYTPNPNANGTDTFTFKVNDGTFDSPPATFTLTINPLNDAPVASNGTLTVSKNVPKSGTLVATDVDGDALTYSIAANGSKGTAVVTNASNGAFTYTPNPNVTGTDTFYFWVYDGTTYSSPATISVTILDNQAPVANNGTFATDEDAVYNTGQLSATDADGNALTYSLVTNGSKGTATITNATTGAFTYVPSPNANGSDTFTFKANDGYVDSNIATISVTINPVNDAPQFAGGATFALAPIAEDAFTNAGTAIIDLIASGGAGAITDVDAGALQGLALVGANAANGSWQFSTDKGVAWNLVGVPGETTALLLAADKDAQNVPLTRIRFVPAPDFNGTIVGALTFRAWDRTSGGNGTTANISANGGTTAFSPTTKTASLTVTPVNDPPAAANGNLGVMEDSLANPGTLVATDVENSPLTYSIATNGTKGTAVVTNASTGAYTYTPSPNAFGSDTFTFKAYDGALYSNVATISVNITNVNDQPTVQGATLTTDEDVAVPVTLSAQDLDDDPLTYTIDPLPQHGTLTGTAPNLIYTPAAEYSGPDSFVFKVNDGTVDSGTATVTITVNNLNDAPVLSATAVFQMDSILEDETDNSGTLIKDLINNAGAGVITDADATPEQGLALFGFYNPGGDFEWSSDNGLTWQPMGGGGNTLLLYSDDDTRIRFVPPSNANGTIDPIFSVRAWDRTTGNNGDVVTITQTGGASAFSAQAKTVRLDIAPVNDAPVAFDDFDSVIYENETANPWIYANDPDLTPIDDLTFVVVTPPEHGTLTGTGYQLTYTPDPDFYGIDTFYFLANDGELDSNVAQILITVLEVDDEPPVVESFAPSAESWVNIARPTIAVTYSDYFSGVDPELVYMSDSEQSWSVDLSAIAGPTGFTYTPNFDLTEGHHLIWLNLGDYWYNQTGYSSRFYVDTLSPWIDMMTPVDGGDAGPGFDITVSAVFGDPLYDPNNFGLASGIDLDRVFIIIDGEDVTDSGYTTITEDGFSYYPGEMAEGTHTVSVTIYDRAGNSASEAWNFRCYRHSIGYIWSGGGSTNNWTDAGNWINLQSGPSYPFDGATVIFDATSSKDCTINGPAGRQVGWMIVSPGYKGQIKVDAPSFYAGGDLVFRGGVFDAGNAQISIQGDMELSGDGGFIAGTSNVTFMGDWSSSTVTGAPGFATVTIQKTLSTDQVAFQDGATIGTLLDVQSGTFTSGPLIVNGNLSIDPAVNVPIGLSVIAPAPGTHTLDFGGKQIFDLTIADNSNYITRPVYTLNGGFTTAPGGTFTIHADCDLYFEAGKTFAVKNLDWRPTNNIVQLFRSGTSGSWKLESEAPQSVVNIWVGNCDASGGATFTGYYSEDLGGNTNWIFATDITSPEIAITNPAEGSIVTTKRPVVTGTWSDPESQVDQESAGVVFYKSPSQWPEVIQGNLVTSATGFTYTPTENLGDGLYIAEALVYARANGYPGIARNQFTIDTTPPAIAAHAPATGTITNDLVITADYQDSGTGINTSGIQLLLEYGPGFQTIEDVTSLATISNSNLSFTLPSSYADDFYRYTIIVPDNGGLATTVSEVVELDKTPPPLPVIDQTIRTYDRVTVAGLVAADIQNVNLENITGASNEFSMLNGAFVIVFMRTGGDAFSFDLSLTDLAGNTGPTLAVNESFLTDPPPNPPDPALEPPLQILGVSLIPDAGKTKIERDGVTLSNSENFTVKFMVAGGVRPYQATVNAGAQGNPVAGSGSVFQMQLNGVPEGLQDIAINVTDSAGSSASATATLISDRSGPKVALSTPLKKTTADLSVLVLGPANLQVYTDPATQDPETLRNVFGYATFNPAGNVQDEFTEPVEIRVSVREVEQTNEGLRHDFTSDLDSEILARPESSLPLAAGADLEKPWTYSAVGGNLAVELEEWAQNREQRVMDLNGNEVNFASLIMPAMPVDTHYFTTFKTYQLFVTTRDALGNERTERVLDFAKDLTAPEIRGYRVFSPVISVNTDNDVFQMTQETSSGQKQMRRTHYWELPQYGNAFWSLAEPVPFIGTSIETRAIGIYAEDIAGNITNTSNGTNAEARSTSSSPNITIKRLDMATTVMWGNFEDNGRRRPLAGDEQLCRGLPQLGEQDQRFLVKYPRAWAGISIGFYTSYNPGRPNIVPFYNNSTGLENVSPINGNPLQGPQTLHRAEGLWPTPVRLLLPRADEMAETPNRIPGRVYQLDMPRDDGIPSQAIFNQTGYDSLTVNLQGFDLPPADPQFVSEQTFFNEQNPANHMGPNFVWNEIDPATVGTDPQLDNPPSGYQPGQDTVSIRLAGLKRDQQPGFSGFQYSLSDSDNSGNPAVRKDTTSWSMPGNNIENLNLIRVEPSTLLAGQRQTIDIIGGELALIGESIDPKKIVFKNSTTGQVVSGTDDLPAEQWTDKIIIHSAIGAGSPNAGPLPISTAGALVQRMRMEVTIGQNIPLAFFDIYCQLANGSVTCQLKEAINIARMQLLLGQVDPTTGRGALGDPTEVLTPATSGMDLASCVKPVVTIQMTTIENIHQDPDSPMQGDLTISGKVTYALADIVPNNEFDPTEATVLLNGESIGTTTLVRLAESPAFLRPYACSFEFQNFIPNVPVRMFNNRLQVIVEDSVSSQIGVGNAIIEINAIGAEEIREEMRSNPIPSDAENRTLNLDIDLSGGSTLQEIEALGATGVPLSVPNPITGNPTNYPGHLTISNGIPTIMTDDGIFTVTLVDFAQIGLDEENQGFFVATAGKVGSAQISTFFRETSAQSSIYRAVNFTIALTATTQLDLQQIDSIACRLHENEFEQAPGTEEILLETSQDSYTFASQNTKIFFPSGFQLDPNSRQSLAVTMEVTGRGTHQYILFETGRNTSTFTLPLTGQEQATYLDRMLKGPWEVISVEYQEVTDFGAFRPFVTQVEVCPELKQNLLANGKCNVFGLEHQILEYSGKLYCAGSPAPGVFAIQPDPTGLGTEGTFGAGHFSIGRGFVFTSLAGSFLNAPTATPAQVATKKLYVEGGGELYRRLIKISDSRRQARFKGDPATPDGLDAIKNSYNDPKWLTYPLTEFSQFAWDNIWVMARGLIVPPPAGFDAAVNQKALELLATPDPRFDSAGFPVDSCGLSKLCFDLPATATLPPLPAIAGHPTVVGSKFLLGHWDPPAAGLGQVNDYTSQSQNLTDILHFNSGIGYGKLSPRLNALFFGLNGSAFLPADARKITVVQLFYHANILELAMAIADDPDAHPDFVNEAPKYADVSGTISAVASDPLAAFRIGDAELAIVRDVYAKLQNSLKYIEVSRILAMTNAWRGNFTRDSLDLFLAYDAASKEGFEVFGIDALNDIIITETGARFGQAMEGDPANGKEPLVFTSSAEVQSAIDNFVNESRRDLLRHPVFSPPFPGRDRIISAFMSVQFAHDGTHFKPVDAAFERSNPIWKSTLGMILEKNKDAIRNEDLALIFCDEVESHIESGSISPISLDVTLSTGGVVQVAHIDLSADDVLALHQVVEVLAFIGVGRSGRGE